MSVVRPIPRRASDELPFLASYRVTTHVVRRYIERVLRYPVGPEFGGRTVPADDVAWIERMRQVIDCAAIQDEIFTICGPAMKSGARSAFRDHFVYILSPSGTVTTVIPVSSYMAKPLGGHTVKRKKARRRDDDLDDVRHYGGARFAYR